MQIGATAAASGNRRPPAEERLLTYDREIALFSLPGSISELLRHGAEVGFEAVNERLTTLALTPPPAAEGGESTSRRH